MKRFMVSVAVVGLCVLLGIAYAADSAKEKQVKDLVNKAVASFKTNGKEHTLKLLNASAGPFRKRELYVFAVDLNGKNLSHPTNKKLRGIDSWNLKDAKGKLFIQEFIKVAKDPGEGWVEYWWKRHGEKEPTLKRSFIKKVPGENILVGCGYYIK